MIIKLIRHGESESNVGNIDVTQNADSMVSLTNRGVYQAMSAGNKIGKDFLANSLLFRSPYIRTRETSLALIKGAGLDPAQHTWIEDPLLREIELGYAGTFDQMGARKRHGWFYYRYEGGESPADVYTRCAIFIDALMRKPKENVTIVSHGLTVRVFISRFLKLTVEEYTQMENPNNCDIFTICPVGMLTENDNVLFRNKKWAVVGELAFYHKKSYDEAPFIEKLQNFQLP